MDTVHYLTENRVWPGRQPKLFVTYQLSEPLIASQLSFVNIRTVIPHLPEHLDKTNTVHLVVSLQTYHRPTCLTNKRRSDYQPAAMASDQEREHALQALRSKLIESREWEAK